MGSEFPPGEDVSDLPELSELEQIEEGEAHARRDAKDEYCFDEEAEKVAKKRGLVVVYPAENQVQIDLDGEEQFWNFRDWMDAFDIPHEWAEVTPSASGLPNRHATITFPDRTFSEPERIALQMALGSDPVRERLNFLRHWNGIKRPTRLFEKP